MRFARNFSFALRAALQNPVSTAIILATLMLGIGLTTGIFSVFYSVLLEPLPYRHPGQLVLVMEKLPQIPVPINVPPVQALDLSANPAFSGSAIFISSARNLQGGDRPERVDVLRASAELLPLLGLNPSQGRSFTKSEDLNGVRVALISARFERRRFPHGQALGKTLLLDGIGYEIVGVLPERFAFPAAGMSQAGDSANIWVPLSLTSSERSPQNSDYSYSLIARLRAGFTADQAQAATHSAIEQILRQFPPEARKISLQAKVLPLKQQVVAGSHRLLTLLLCAASALLLISCLNVSSILLNRASARRRELALRTALGADAKAIFSQLVTEAAVIFVFGGALGILCAIWSQQALVHLLPSDIPRLTEIHISEPVLAVSLAVSLGMGLLCGLFPAVTTLRTDMAPHLNDSSRSQTTGRGVGRTRQLLVITQLVLVFVLLTAAGLLLRSLSSVLEQQATFRTEKIVSFGLALPESQYSTVSEGHTFYTELSRRLSALPGVISVGFGTDIPFENKSGRLISPEHATVHGNPVVYNTDVAGAYFQSLGLRLLAGRFLTDHDTGDSEPVAIVNQAFAKAFWSTRAQRVPMRVANQERNSLALPAAHPTPCPSCASSGDALDHRFKFGPPSAPSPSVRIVGVAADSGARTPDKPSEPRVYIPLDQDPYKAQAFRETWFVLRTHGDALALGPSLQAAVHSLDPSMPVVKLRSMDQVVSNALAPRSANTWLITVFSTAALLLSLLGIYGVVAQSVSQRRREMGIRMALGARSADISSIVLWEGGRLVAVALAIGIPASFAASDILRTLLFGVPPDDSITRIWVIAVIMASVSLSLLVPLWRAIHVDPQIALREN